MHILKNSARDELTKNQLINHCKRQIHERIGHHIGEYSPDYLELVNILNLKLFEIIDRDVDSEGKSFFWDTLNKEIRNKIKEYNNHLNQLVFKKINGNKKAHEELSKQIQRLLEWRVSPTHPGLKNIKKSILSRFSEEITNTEDDEKAQKSWLILHEIIKHKTHRDYYSLNILVRKKIEGDKQAEDQLSQLIKKIVAWKLCEANPEINKLEQQIWRSFTKELENKESLNTIEQLWPVLYRKIEAKIDEYSVELEELVQKAVLENNQNSLNRLYSIGKSIVEFYIESGIKSAIGKKIPGINKQHQYFDFEDIRQKIFDQLKRDLNRRVLDHKKKYKIALGAIVYQAIRCRLIDYHRARTTKLAVNKTEELLEDIPDEEPASQTQMIKVVHEILQKILVDKEIPERQEERLASLGQELIKQLGVIIIKFRYFTEWSLEKIAISLGVSVQKLEDLREMAIEQFIKKTKNLASKQSLSLGARITFLWHFEGYSLQKIADELDLKIDKIKQARKNFHEKLEKLL